MQARQQVVMIWVSSLGLEFPLETAAVSAAKEVANGDEAAAPAKAVALTKLLRLKLESFMFFTPEIEG